MKKNNPLIYLLSFIIWCLLILISLVLKDWFLVSNKILLPEQGQGEIYATNNIISSNIISSKNPATNTGLINSKNDLLKNKKPILISDVPFTTQAPNWNWSNLMYQEWCEEASLIMAISWVKWSILTPNIANSEIIKISNYEINIFWGYSNTSIYDTAKILQKYYSFNNFKITHNISKNDIINSLANWNILLIPAYWRALHNKNYTTPGPISHMIVIVWYDPITKEFITNDPWTKYWKWFRYDEDILFNAIWDYPTSSANLSAPKVDTIKKSMLEIHKL